MAYDEKTLKRDGSGITPVPQHFNPIADDYEPIYGRNNAGRVELYGPDGNPISTSAGKLAVRASEIEAQLTTIQGHIDGIEGILGTLATASNQATIAEYIDQVESQLTAIQGYIDGLEGAIGIAVASPAANTLLARVKNLEDKLAAIIAGTSPAAVQLTGSTVTKEQAIPYLRTAYYELTTFVNAMSVPAGSDTGYFTFNSSAQGQPNEFWFLILIDQQPWSLSGWAQDGTSGYVACFYPKYLNHTTTYTAGYAKAVYLGWLPGTGQGITTEPTNLIEARQYIIPAPVPAKAKVHNPSASTATVTVKVLKIWR